MKTFRAINVEYSRLMKIQAFLVSLLAATSAAGSISQRSISNHKSGVVVSTGLTNLGNTCYMNAQLECAFHIPAVRDAIAVQNVEEAIGDDPACQQSDTDAAVALRSLFLDMERAAQSYGRPAYPSSFCKALGIPVMVQQDSQEFWKLLLPAVGSESLTDLYKGCFEDYITALDGSGREKRREELFLDLSLDVMSSSNVLDSLRAMFGKPEFLSVAEGNGWRPKKGADKVDAHKGSSMVIQGLPPILQLHLKRFNYDWNTDTTTKLNQRFEFPDTLNLSTLAKLPEAASQKLKPDDSSYELQSVIVHAGEYGVGHYYSYVRPDIRSDTWYRFNDDIVEEVTFDDVTRDAFGGKVNAITNSGQGRPCFLSRIRNVIGGGGRRNNWGWGGRTSNAYVLQYVRKSELAQLYPTK